ncbi:glycosyltransferase family 2 protein [Microbacterium protaetiae]|uniref:Glycosyltransferase family 2 protein n=1 Tax=Microbacterium protaetiae TaxID=2509458 RepID=A0A4P6EGP7_9MICO|nr:glycosyltransferase family 2 protein [Microbacterium protaetiae]QAY60633.1 glycosyltransferase family 2 protein [Microbacterium protaetiae]
MISISAVVPLFRVERYLPDLLASLSAQHPGDYSLEVVFVDDGSPDRSAQLAQDWLDRMGGRGRVIRQPNSGVSAARNAGLDAATGEWLTFPDSDDFLSSDYFRNVARFIRRNDSEIALASTKLLRLHEPDTVARDVHALQFRFMAGNRCVSMQEYPDFFQLNVASAFFRRAELVERGLRFREGLHASEDALFVAELLLGRRGGQVLGLVADAHYTYRRRAARDSAVDQFRRRADTYIDRFSEGYLPLMTAASDQGEVPEWLQSMFLYECQWILPAQLTEEGYAGVLDEHDRARTLQAISACASLVTEKRLFEYDATALPLESRLLLQRLAGRGIPSWVPAFGDRRGTLLVYTGDPEGVVVRGRRDEKVQVTATVETPDYFGQKVLHRWTSVAQTARSVVADGIRRPIRDRRPGDTAAQQQDRQRRQIYRQLRRAIPARATEVRVWKPIPGPIGSAWGRLAWDWQLAQLKWRRTRRKWKRWMRRLLSR